VDDIVSVVEAATNERRIQDIVRDKVIQEQAKMNNFLSHGCSLLLFG
jgi:hypothetical protein